MIKTEEITIAGREFTRTFSDAGLMIERDGARYSEAVDPVDSERVYTETDEPVPDVEIDPAEALARLEAIL